MKKIVNPLLFFVFLFCLSCVTTPVTDSSGDLNEAKYTLHYSMGNSRLADNKPTYAMEEFYEAEKYMKTPELYYSMGRACFIMERYELAEEFFGKSLLLDKNFSMSNVGRGNLYVAQGRFEEAIREFEKALDNILFHERESAFFNMALAYIGLGDYDNAIKNLKKSTQFNPGFLPAYFHLGKVYMDLGDYELASDSFQELLKYYPESPEGHLMLGMAYLKMEMNLMAEMEFREVIKLAPDTEFADEAKKYLTGEKR
jgi:tetratricopeptide (TPR) repeat protein